MRDVLFAAMGLVHLAALTGLAAYYCRRIAMPWREWPLFLFLAIWSAIVVAGYLVSPFDGLGSLPAHAAATFAALGLVLWLHHATVGAPRPTPYAKIRYPVFLDISHPEWRRFLWLVLGATIVVAILIHLTVCFSFYPVNADSLNYRLARVFWYTSHGNVLHSFASIDKRLTFYPIDGLLLYVPIALYGVSAVFFSLPSMFSWLVIAYASYRFARALQAGRLVAFFAAWLAAMTPSILIEASSTNDEILTAAPLLAGLYFAWRWLVSGTEHYFLLAAVGLGLCIGTKLHIFFLLPIMAMSALWFAWFLWRRHESWRKWLPAMRLRVFAASAGAGGFMGLMFLVLNYISSGQFYFLTDTAHQVLNLGASLQDATQNFIIYTASMILAPIADLNIWQTFREREVTNRELNDIFAPLIAPFVSNDPHFFHLKYRFQGVIIPTSVLMVEYGLWPGFMWLLWFLQAAGLRREKFSLRPVFIVLAATPVIWLLIWSCVTLYMEGVPTYFAFYLMCAAPAMVFCFIPAASKLRDRIRWGIITFVVATTIIIDGNVGINNTFRGLWHFTEDKPWPYDWLLFEQPIVDEIRRAEQIHIAITHGKVYYFAFMHWNPGAIYYSPYDAPPDSIKVLHILTTPSEFSYGFMPIKIPGKLTPGITYLGHIRGVDREEVFAFGNNVDKRYPYASDFISMHASILPARQGYTLRIDPTVAGLNNPADRLEFSYEIKAPDGKAVYLRGWKLSPVFTTDLPQDLMKVSYVIVVRVRSDFEPDKVITQTFALSGSGAWRIGRPGDTAANDDDF